MAMVRWGPFIAVAISVTSSGVSAQQSLQGLERESQFQHALDAVDAIKRQKRLQCVLSVQDGAVCQCLSQNLPVDTYVRGYAAIVHKQGEYAQLSSPARAIVDRCVGDIRGQ